MSGDDMTWRHEMIDDGVLAKRLAIEADVWTEAADVALTYHSLEAAAAGFRRIAEGRSQRAEQISERMRAQFEERFQEMSRRVEVMKRPTAAACWLELEGSGPSWYERFNDWIIRRTR